jgi:1-acyl-sn-glycerol-3-phosphate acyltransferase
MIASIRRSYAGIGMAELRNGGEWPWIIGKGFDLLGHIPIDRGNAESGANASTAALHALRYGAALAVWPHGRQVQKGKPETWFTGYARFALQSGAKIHVLKVEGVEDFWQTHPDNGGPQGINWKAKIRAAFSGPIDPAKYQSVDELDAAVKRIIADMRLPA